MTEIDLHVEGGDTLTFDRDALVNRLKERLAANEATRQAAKEKAAARNKERYDRIVAAMDNPQFLVWLVGLIRTVEDLDPASDTFAAMVAESWPDTDGEDLPEEFDPDHTLRNLIDAYELAKDPEIKLTVRDEAYRYLPRPKTTATAAEETPATE